MGPLLDQELYLLFVALLIDQTQSCLIVDITFFHVQFHLFDNES